MFSTAGTTATIFFGIPSAAAARVVARTPPLPTPLPLPPAPPAAALPPTRRPEPARQSPCRPRQSVRTQVRRRGGNEVPPPVDLFSDPGGYVEARLDHTQQR